MPTPRHATTRVGAASVFLRRWLWSPWSLKSLSPSRSFLVVLTYVMAVLAVAFSYYFYLNALYMVDEVLEGDALRELTLHEKTTIYVHAPVDMEHLKRFVLHYAICPTVHEIKVRSRSEWRDIVLDESLFKYTKTHSLVTFEPAVAAADDDAAVFQLQAVATEGVFYLDADVFVSCDDVAFTHSVWRSASDAPVGYFPRAHSRVGQKDAATGGQQGQQWQLLGWRYVATQGAYSVMLSAAAMVHKKFVVKGVTSTTFGTAPTAPAPAPAPAPVLTSAATAASEREAGGGGGKGDTLNDPKADAKSDPKSDVSAAGHAGGRPRVATDRIGLVTVSEADKLTHMKALGQAMARAPCLRGGAGLALPLLAAALGAAPAVWVDVPYELKKIGGPEGSAPPPALRDACLTELAAALRLQTVTYSWHKATRAKDHLFW